MATEKEIHAWQEWVEGMVAARRDEMPADALMECEEDLRQQDYRVLALSMVTAALNRDDIPALSTQELEQARRFNELGFFGKRSQQYFRNLLQTPDAVVELAPNAVANTAESSGLAA